MYTCDVRRRAPVKQIISWSCITGLQLMLYIRLPRRACELRACWVPAHPMRDIPNPRYLIFMRERLIVLSCKYDNRLVHRLQAPCQPGVTPPVTPRIPPDSGHLAGVLHPCHTLLHPGLSHLVTLQSLVTGAHMSEYARRDLLVHKSGAVGTELA